MPKLLGIALLTALPTISPAHAKYEELKDFANIVLADTTNTWKDIFSASNRTYTPPHLVLYSGQINSPCGEATNADGPFYCPGDQTLYIDPEFLRDLKSRYTSPGDFALAYTIAHEVGHHVQNQWGILSGVNKLPLHVKNRDVKSIPVDLELQADCLAGVWASKQAGSLSDHVIRAGMNAAHNEIGNEPREGVVTLKQNSHGTQAQRVSWFKRGYTAASPANCNSFWEQ